jgi:hypothetical protein
VNGKIARRLLSGAGAPVFTPDGRLLLCTSSSGVSVYEWSAVKSAELDASAPAPVYVANAEAVTFHVGGVSQTMAGVYDIAYDALRHRALFCGLAGRICALDLSSGAVADVVAIPGRPPVYRLALSRDGQAVACVAKPGMFERTPQPQRLQIWKL